MMPLQKLDSVGNGGIFGLFVAFTDEHVDLQQHPEATHHCSASGLAAGPHMGVTGLMPTLLLQQKMEEQTKRRF